LGEFFYKRGLDPRATTAINVDEVMAAVLAQLDKAVPVGRDNAANDPEGK
jgi:hypothetical protein